MKLAVAAALAAAASAAPPPFPACCAYGGSGSVTAFGTGVLNAFAPAADDASRAPTGPADAAPMAVGVSTSRSFSAVLFAAATGPEDARAGWIVSTNSTNDVLYVFANVSASGPTCSVGVTPRGAMMGAFAFCGGAGGAFATLARSFQLTPATAVGVFEKVDASGAATATAAFADAAACAPVSLTGASSPFGTGAFSVNFESGSAAEPPAAWAQPPSWCAGKW